VAGVMTSVDGLNGVDGFRFNGKTSGGRRVSVEVPKGIILELAAALQHTDSPGHAVWHIENKERSIPCESCRG
jgi:hypothetical protein